MARPKKETVDYFPHICAHKTTIFVLEQKYGNDGYAFWFKILELLASSEGHYYDCRKPHLWEFLQAKTRLSEDKCNELLDLLAKLDAIDQKLWDQRIIWSDNFVAGIADVYRNRRVEIPSKPSFYKKKPRRANVSTDRNPQSKVKESKGNIEEPSPQHFMDYFNEKTGKKLKLTNDRKELIKKRLAEGYTIDQLKKAVDNFILDDWDQRHKYIDVIYCIGKQRGKPDNLERWLYFTPPGTKKDPITVTVAISLISRNQTQSTMENILDRLPPEYLEEFVIILKKKSKYLHRMYLHVSKKRAKEDQ